ncbi:MAG: cob(I)yrinic acid a,c-diamide adenosyltransferase [Deltaproteobacteria bacterium]|nr:cob(I)yrinic acid a,c-diamide adenosyltransferase [Deltaproteobacteria bacterium]MBW2046570.1 cob(I)yrinic acid a,c-diamide adenosyltransferase [Deltaproteobacteria bacterium]MBW2302047.1 cob(I)yrinic acid a,c-diamide adenosyltransferase [Deltaproteobacteria bacterium]
MKGYVQVYTGDGKGKTTAAFGLALRAAGAGLKVFIGQFLKGQHYSELDSIARFSDVITLKQLGSDCLIRKHPEPEDVRAARDGLETVKEVLASGEYSVVILDEANVAVHYGLFPVEELLELIDSKTEDVELIITGRYAHNKILRKADLVTEMKNIKHYYDKGVMARRGIER